jgi:hypothetical protein
MVTAWQIVTFFPRSEEGWRVFSGKSFFSFRNFTATGNVFSLRLLLIN